MKQSQTKEFGGGERDESTLAGGSGDLVEEHLKVRVASLATSWVMASGGRSQATEQIQPQA